MFDFGDTRKTAKDGLFDVVCKGIDLLVADYLDEELLKSWKKYANTALELVDKAYKTRFYPDFIISENTMYETSFYPYLWGHDWNSHANIFPSVASFGSTSSHKDTRSYRVKLQRWVIMLLNILRRIP